MLHNHILKNKNNQYLFMLLNNLEKYFLLRYIEYMWKENMLLEQRIKGIEISFFN